MDLTKIASEFRIDGTIDRVEALGEGFINE